MTNWLLDLLSEDEYKYIRPKSTPEKIYKDNKQFCDDRGITIEEIRHDIKEGWLYPSEMPKINFSGTYAESKSELSNEQQSRKRMNKRMMENHRGDISYRIRNDERLQQGIDELRKRSGK